MGKDLILETTFLIDLEREVARGEQGPAQAFLERHAEQNLYLTFTVAGELAAGESLAERSRWEEFVAPFHILAFTLEVAWQYGQVFRYLQDNGLLIGSNDLWIAATGLAHNLSVLTRNVGHFRRVPGLEVLDYRSV